MSNGPIKDIEKLPKGKQKHNDKWYCNNTNINTFPNNMWSGIPELKNRVTDYDVIKPS